MRTVEKRDVLYTRLATMAKPKPLLRGFLFALETSIYFAILMELVLLAFVIKALV